MISAQEARHMLAIRDESVINPALQQVEVFIKKAVENLENHVLYAFPYGAESINGKRLRYLLTEVYGFNVTMDSGYYKITW